MAGLPLLIFPHPQRIAPPTRSAGFGAAPPPRNLEAQSARIARQFETVQAAFSTVAIDTEKVLVVETIGKVSDFHKAVAAVGGMEWLGEIDEDEIDLDVDEWYAGAKEEERKKIKKAGGRLYLTVSNKQAIDRLLGLWDKWKQEGGVPRGFGKWKEIFVYLHDLRLWNHRDMFAENGLLDMLKEDIQKGETVHGDKNAKFEVELHYRRSDGAAKQAVEQVTAAIVAVNGSVDVECRISEAAFHALKVSIPFSALQPFLGDGLIASDVGYLQPEYVKFCRPMATAVVVQNDEPVAEQRLNLPACDEELPPVIALLDGVPFLQHQYLDERILFDDPDEFSDRYSSIVHRKHGTAMASMICHGDLKADLRQSLLRKIYVRPIMIGPTNKVSNEHVAPELFVEDVILRAVKHLKESPAASSVRIINLSFGIVNIPFIQSMSSLARVLDYLASEYQLLFIVSAGNQKFVYQSAAPGQPQAGDVIQELNNNQRHGRILSPAESINALTVGAVNDDEFTSPPPGEDKDLLAGHTAAALYSRLGNGFRAQIKPDILVNGGRAYYRKGLNDEWHSPPVTMQGINHAYPDRDNPENLNGQDFTIGTSNAAALTTHAAGQLYEILRDIRGGSDSQVDERYMALLIKALLAHGASRERLSGLYEQELGQFGGARWKSYFSRFVGYGIPDFEQVKECTDARVVVLGYGNIGEKRRDLYRLPIPLACRDSSFVRVVVSLAWFSKISPRRQLYRQSKLHFSFVNEQGKSNTEPKRVEYDWQQVRKGTLQHEIYELSPDALGDHLNIAVDCYADADDALSSAVPYGLAVTLEVAEGVDIYQDVKTAIAPSIPA